jgi:hypothetical protein
MMGGKLSARREGTKRRFLLAGLRLAESGQFGFLPEDVAEDAGLSRRNFFTIFDTVDAYTDELLD